MPRIKLGIEIQAEELEEEWDPVCTSEFVQHALVADQYLRSKNSNE